MLGFYRGGSYSRASLGTEEQHSGTTDLRVVPEQAYRLLELLVCGSILSCDPGGHGGTYAIHEVALCNLHQHHLPER